MVARGIRKSVYGRARIIACTARVFPEEIEILLGWLQLSSSSRCAQRSEPRCIKLQLEALSPNHLERCPEQPIEIGSERLLLGNRLFNGLLGCGPLIAKIRER